MTNKKEESNSSLRNMIATLFYLAEKGELEKIDTNEYILTIINYAITPETADYKLRIKKFKREILNFLKKLETSIEEAERTSDKVVNFMLSQQKRIESLPPFTTIDDNEKIVSFARGLEKDLFNFSEAANLLEGKITRQTLSRKISEGFLEIKPLYKGKSFYILKKDLINIYRHFFETDTWGF